MTTLFMIQSNLPESISEAFVPILVSLLLVPVITAMLFLSPMVLGPEKMTL